MSGRIFAGGLVLVALLGCGARPQARTVAPMRVLDPEAGLQVGAAAIDVTPPPGLSLFGYGPESRVAMGWRARLECQAIVLTRGEQAMALVPCDLSAISSDLHHAVAGLLVDEGVPIGRGRVMLMASHTHAGFAHYFGARSYSGTFSTRLMGYDPKVLEWLSERIASAIKSAFAARAPARIHWGQRQVNGLTRNRSLAPFMSNERMGERNGQRVPLLPRGLHARIKRSSRPETVTPDPALDNLSLAELAVDPTLWVMRALPAGDPEGDPLAVFAIFGMHQTALSAHNELYQPDAFGFARRALERELGRCGSAEGTEPAVRVAGKGCTVVGLANGIEGDVSPNVMEQTSREAQRLGERLAAEVLEVKVAGEPQSQILDGAYRELRLPGARVEAGGGRLCEVPELGVAAGGGAEDGRTTLGIVPAVREGQRAPRRDGCHGDKLILQVPFRPTDDNEYQFPERMPVALLRIGDMGLSTVPGEITTAAGLRLLDSVADALPQVPHTALVGLTNGYLQYIATREEYALQHYEGASTVYGPRSARFFETHLTCLAAWLDHGRTRPRLWRAGCELGQSPVEALHALDSKPEPIQRRWPREPDIPDVHTRELEVEKILHEGERAFQVEWWGPDRGFATSQHQVHVEVTCLRHSDKCAGKRADDRDGSVIVRIGNRRRDDAYLWEAIWIPSATRTHAPWCEPHRFTVTAHGRFESKPFRATPRWGCDPDAGADNAGTSEGGDGDAQ
ncbi:MAG: neutral/alkaline non-lysosomal ceramidase N-terminal domain-containing protein [Myxococcales bacterium]|nr:neutral/alkaline non-lysosomal ceramidase N-terminal domain-containing protein [Myxococcales bacterium]